MSLRAPDLKAQDSFLDPLGLEIMGEKAASLGRAGEKVERSLAALRAHEGSPADRAAVLRTATQAVHAYFIQRELCGLRRHDDVIREYRIPREVLFRLGAQ